MLPIFPSEVSRVIPEIPKDFLRDPAEVELLRQQVMKVVAKQKAEEAKKPQASYAYLFGYLIGQRDAEFQKGYRDGFREAMR